MALKQRVLTALVLLPFGIAAVFWLNPTGFAWLIAVLLGLGAWEWCQFIGLKAQSARVFVGAIVAAAILWLLLQAPSVDPRHIGLMGIVIVAGMSLWLANREFSGRALKGLTGLLVLLISALALGSLTAEGIARYWLMLLLLVIWGADVGAYFSGRFWGKKKLAPNISPGKTWAGVWGGMAVATLVCGIASFAIGLDPKQSAGLIVTGMITAAVSVIGDLFISLLKRQVGLKDASQLFPGHGGVLDRFDSLIAAAPVFLLGWTSLSL